VKSGLPQPGLVVWLQTNREAAAHGPGFPAL
jgi:hypothetical protein